MANIVVEGNPPAFPVVANNNVYNTGMTLRDYFAAQVLSINEFTYGSNPDAIASDAYAIADSMLEARQK